MSYGTCPFCGQMHIGVVCSDATPPVQTTEPSDIDAVMREIENFATVSMVYGGKGRTVCETRDHVRAVVLKFAAAPVQPTEPK